MRLPQEIAEDVARAFARTFWFAVATIVIAFIPTLFLPSHGAVSVQNVIPKGSAGEGDAAGGGAGGEDTDDSGPPSDPVVAVIE